MIYSYSSTNKYIKDKSCDYITRVAFEITKKTEQKNYPFARSTHSFKIAIHIIRMNSANGLDIHSGVGVVGLSEEAAGLLVGDAVGSFVLFIILFTCVTSNSRIVALHHYRL